MIKTTTATLPGQTRPGKTTVQAAPRMDPLTGQPFPPRGEKFGNQPCYDLDGKRYASLVERDIHLAFKRQADAGHCTEPERGVYQFWHQRDGEDFYIGKYTSDIEFHVHQTFTVVGPAAVYKFEAGQRYVIDVKSPVTMTEATYLRVQLMKAFKGIDVLLFYTASPDAGKGKARPRAKKTKRG